MSYILTGFHAIQEQLLNSPDSKGQTVFFSKAGPRVKQILEIAKKNKIKIQAVDNAVLDLKTKDLSPEAKDHRGVVLECATQAKTKTNIIDFNSWLLADKKEKITTVLVLDHITDPHNIGAIFRSADQFGVDLVVMPQKRSPDPKESQIIARSSSGAVAWVNICTVSNLVQCVKTLKQNGFWIYAADTEGDILPKVEFEKKTCIVMGAEGSGLQDLLKKQCDTVVSIPTVGKVDSLNVSVAAGILLYERKTQEMVATLYAFSGGV